MYPEYNSLDTFPTESVNLDKKDNQKRNKTDTTNLNDDFIQEVLLEMITDDAEDSKLLDFLDNLRLNPYDLNTVTEEKLEQIPFLTGIAAKNIIIYREKNGTFISKKELLEIDGVTPMIYNKIKYFVYVKNSREDFVINEKGEIIPVSKLEQKNITYSKNYQVQFKSRIQQELQTKEGYQKGIYPGNKLKLYNQLNLKYIWNNYRFEGNFTMEKDPGETDIADFNSGYLQVSNKQILNKVIIGDYTLDFGQGIGMWSSLAFSKSADAVVGVKKRNRGLNGYRSANEVQFFRGIAADVNYSDFNIFLFYSDNYLDATIDSTLNEVSSIYFDGYHRTQAEQKRDNSFKEKLAGGRVYFHSDAFKFGVTYWYANYSKTIKADTVKQLYNFSGRRANMLSFDYDIIFKNINFYGEIGRSQNGVLAGIGALQFSFYKIADVVVLYRNYPEDFSPVHSFGFGDKNGNTINEKGLYTGISFNPLKNIEINSYFDQYKFPYRTYYNPIPIGGNDFMGNFEWKISNDLFFNLRYRNRNEEETRTVQDIYNRDVKLIDNRNQMNIRVEFLYELSNIFKIRSRYEYVMIRYKRYGENNKGLLFFTDVEFIPVNELTVSTRFVYFQTDNYDSRIYEYEKDIPGILSNLALYGKGKRIYVLFKYKIYDFIQLYGKYAETFFDGVESIGSGYDTIDGDINNKINLGIIVNF
ncbi:MAG: helix-hairpin-helix domain-containing protein [Ignavibacteria bacterium]|nr:helix-hairpin-helix domain-containing protein [Ignavibacteria bacterium]